MEDISILEFLAASNGSGAGWGAGWGDDSGDGWSAGWGAGWGDDSGAGWGDDSGAGWCISRGDGWSDGWGAGSGGGIKLLNDLPVSFVDGVETIIEKVRGSIARGYILNADLTLKPCFVCKSENFFAHGETIHEAMESLRSKLLEGLPTERRIELFRLEHEADVKYPNTDFFEWHHRLTGSCLMGRKTFAEAHGIDLSKEMTVNEFIELTKNSYGGDVICRLAEKYREN